jgi:hypothetical protein
MSFSEIIKLWSADHRQSPAVRHVIRGGPQAVSEEKALQKFFPKHLVLQSLFKKKYVKLMYRKSVVVTT